MKPSNPLLLVFNRSSEQRNVGAAGGCGHHVSVHLSSPLLPVRQVIPPGARLSVCLPVARSSGPLRTTVCSERTAGRPYSPGRQPTECSSGARSAPVAASRLPGGRRCVCAADRDPVTVTP